MTTIAVMGTKRLIATAIQDDTIVHGGIQEMTDRSPEAVDPLGTAGRRRATLTARIDAVVDPRMAEDPQEEDLATPPGLAPGSVKAKAESARSKTPSRSRHCRGRRRIAGHGFAPSTAPYR